MHILITGPGGLVRKEKMKTTNFGEKLKAHLTAEVAAGKMTAETAKEMWQINCLLGRMTLENAKTDR